MSRTRPNGCLTNSKALTIGTAERVVATSTRRISRLSDIRGMREVRPEVGELDAPFLDAGFGDFRVRRW